MHDTSTKHQERHTHSKWCNKWHLRTFYLVIFNILVFVSIPGARTACLNILDLPLFSFFGDFHAVLYIKDKDPYCRSFRNEFLRVKAMYAKCQREMKFFVVDCSAHSLYCRYKNVIGVPSLHLINNRQEENISTPQSKSDNGNTCLNNSYFQKPKRSSTCRNIFFDFSPFLQRKAVTNINDKNKKTVVYADLGISERIYDFIEKQTKMVGELEKFKQIQYTTGKSALKLMIQGYCVACLVYSDYIPADVRTFFDKHKKYNNFEATILMSKHEKEFMDLMRIIFVPSLLVISNFDEITLFNASDRMETFEKAFQYCNPGNWDEVSIFVQEILTILKNLSSNIKILPHEANEAKGDTYNYSDSDKNDNIEISGFDNEFYNYKNEINNNNYNDNNDNENNRNYKSYNGGDFDVMNYLNQSKFLREMWPKIIVKFFSPNISTLVYYVQEISKDSLLELNEKRQKLRDLIYRIHLQTGIKSTRRGIISNTEKLCRDYFLIIQATINLKLAEIKSKMKAYNNGKKGKK